MFDDWELPAEIAAVAAKGHHNVVFVPRTPTRYYEYAPMFHLVPAACEDPLSRTTWIWRVGSMDRSSICRCPVDLQCGDGGEGGREVDK
ncbi:hypothetical protein ACFQO7_31910 [Catellatospora aurea]|uniref:Uncharacterized protein n=1 Tax=Catellatospora aurea TaxID=1337874 RepID=A0ABW2H5B4_9ACTN